MTTPTPSKPLAATQRARRWIGALLAALTLGLMGAMATTQHAQAEVIDRIVAQINSEIITLHDLKRASGPYLFAFGIDPRQVHKRDDADKIYQQVLQDMINTRLLIQEARELQIDVSDGDVNNWIRNIYGQMGIGEQQFRDSLRSRGIRWSDYRRYVHDNLLKVRVIQIRVGSKIKITEDEVLKVYRETFGEDPENGLKAVSVSHIFIPVPKDSDDTKRALIKDLVEKTHTRVTAGQEDFKDVAKEVSAGPTAADGGFLGTYRPGELSDTIDAAIFSAEENSITKPVDVGNGYHIFRVHGIEFERDPRVAERIAKLRQQMREQELNRELDTWLQNIRDRAYIRILY